MAINPNEAALQRPHKVARNFKPELLAKYTTDLAPPFHCNKVEGACNQAFDNEAGIALHVHRKHLRTTDPNTPSRKPQARKYRKLRAIKNKRTYPNDLRCGFKRCGFQAKSPAGFTRHINEMHNGKQPAIRAEVIPINGGMNGNGKGARQLMLNGNGSNGHSLARLQRIPASAPEVLWCPIPVEKVYHLVQHAINFAATS